MEAGDVEVDAGRRRAVRVDDSLLDYALEIVERTRQTEQLTLGVSPRGLLMLQRAAQARAFLEGRDFCLPDDFKQLVLPVFAHRVVVNTRYATTQKKSAQAEAILSEISNPRAFPSEEAFSMKLSADSGERSAPSQADRWQGLDRPGWRSFRHRHAGAGGGAVSGAVFRSAPPKSGHLFVAGDRPRSRRWRWPAGWRSRSCRCWRGARRCAGSPTHRLQLTREGIVYLADFRRGAGRAQYRQ